MLETFMRRPGEVSPPRAARARLGHAREPLERRRRLRPLPAREDRPAVRDRTIETVRGAGYRLRADGGAPHLSRLAIRIRLTLAFVLALGVVLAATGMVPLPAVRVVARRDRGPGAASRDRHRSGDRGRGRGPGRGRDVHREGGGFRAGARRRREGGRRDPGRRRRTVRDPSRARPDETQPPVGIARRDDGGIDGGARRSVRPWKIEGHAIVVVVAAEESEEALRDLLATSAGRWPRRAPAGFAAGIRRRRRCAPAGRGDAEQSGGDLDRTAWAEAAAPARPRRAPRARRDAERRCLGGSRARSSASAGFVADASHELRTPLTLLKTELELALRRPAHGRSSPRRSLRLGRDDRLVQLAEDLLVLARADRGGSCRAGIGPGATLARRGRSALPAPWRGLRAVDRGRRSGRAGLHGDRLRLEQALGNLVANARRHGRGSTV